MAKTKIDENTVVEVRSQQIRRVYSKQELLDRKTKFEENLANINDLLSVFD